MHSMRRRRVLMGRKYQTGSAFFPACIVGCQGIPMVAPAYGNAPGQSSLVGASDGKSMTSAKVAPVICYRPGPKGRKSGVLMPGLQMDRRSNVRRVIFVV
jgi:hypothetical protein